MKKRNNDFVSFFLKLVDKTTSSIYNMLVDKTTSGEIWKKDLKYLPYLYQNAVGQ